MTNVFFLFHFLLFFFFITKSKNLQDLRTCINLLYYKLVGLSSGHILYTFLKLFLLWRYTARPSEYAYIGGALCTIQFTIYDVDQFEDKKYYPWQKFMHYSTYNNYNKLSFWYIFHFTSRLSFNWKAFKKYALIISDNNILSLILYVIPKEKCKKTNYCNTKCN